jgi:hypothetical protein
MTLTREQVRTLREERVQLIARAEAGGVFLSPADFGLDGDELTLDGMPAGEWIEAMCE